MTSHSRIRHQMHHLPVLVGVAVFAVLASCVSASAYTVSRSDHGAAAGYIGYTGGKLPKFWQTTSGAAGAAVTATAASANAAVTASTVKGYIGYVDGRIPQTWVPTTGGGPQSTGPIEPPATPKAAPVASAPQSPIAVPDDGAPVLPWILAAAAFALVAAGLSLKILASRRTAALGVTPRV